MALEASQTKKKLKKYLKYPQFWLKASSRRKRVYSMLVMFVLAILITLMGALIPASPEAIQAANQLNQNAAEWKDQGTLDLGIFLNNFPLCLVMFIPLVGLFFGMFVLFNTGQAFRAIFEIQVASGTSTATSPDISMAMATLALIGIGVVFLLEFTAYSIGMVESIWLFRRLLQGKWRSELKWLCILIGIVALLLIIGAVVETATINLA